MNSRPDPEILTGADVSTRRQGANIAELVAEYEAKRDELSQEVEAFKRAGDVLKSAATMRGTWGNVTIDVSPPFESSLADSLLKSAWRHVFQVGGFERIASANDKRLFEQMFAKPPAFTEQNVWEVFSKYRDPRSAILRGMAEVFSQLDPAFKSHEKMKIGMKGLPKRVILSSVGSWGSWGYDRLRDLLNALAAYQGLPLMDGFELSLILNDGQALRDGGEFADPSELRRYQRILRSGQDLAEKPQTRTVPARGVWLKRFQNGNGHLYFTTGALRDINNALAEYYGDVLPDCPDERPAKQRTGTSVSKDLQYYPTPVEVVNRVIADGYSLKGARVLEPSCGCGRFMDAVRTAGGDVVGCEVDPVRAAMCEAKGHRVMRMNFLETIPTADFDHVVMNPPFFGRHYAKHVKHALRFLKPGGLLRAILPATARYDHGELDDLRPRWDDLPVGSFSESGTNINTTVATIRVPA
jgi:hypothetical protein